jgi:hypothetical protein
LVSLTAKLSKQQKVILRAVLEDERAGAEEMRRALGRYDAVFRGAYYWSLNGYSRSEQASMSRALHRLQARGLVRCENHINEGRRTTHVALTDAGRAIAETVNIPTACRDVNRLRGVS